MSRFDFETGMGSACALLLCHVVGCQRVDTIIAEWRSPSVVVDAGAPPTATSAPTLTPPPPAPPDASVVDAPDAAPPDAGGAPGPMGEAFYFEAESALLSGPFGINAAAEASAGQYIQSTEAAAYPDAPGPGRALYSVTATRAGDFVLWGRIHSPDALNNQFWIRVDDQPWQIWRISTGDVWYWDDVHVDTNYSNPLVFTLAAGPHELEVATATEGAQLDRFYLTSLGDVPPGNDTPCNPPHSVELAGQCAPSCGSHGNTSCIATDCEGLPLLEAYDCPVCCQLP